MRKFLLGMMCVVSLATSRRAHAADASKIVNFVGGVVLASEAQQLAQATTAMMGVSIGLATLSLGGSIFNMVELGRHERYGRISSGVALAAGISSLISGGISMAMYANVTSIAPSVIPSSARPDLYRTANGSLAAGVTAMASGLLNIGVAIAAYQLPEDARTTIKQVSFTPIVLPDSAGSLAPGLGAMVENVTRYLPFLLIFAASSAFANPCTNCPSTAGGFVSIASAQNLINASAGSAAASAALGLVSVGFFGANLAYTIKGERPPRLVYTFGFFFGGASVVMGSVSVILGANLRNLAPDVSPAENQAGVRRDGNVAIAIGASVMGAGLLNLALGIAAFTRPEALADLPVAIAPITLLDRNNNLAPGLGASFPLN